MLAAHGFESPFAESGGGAFFATQHVQQAPQVAQISAAFERDAVFSNGFAASRADYGGGDNSSSTELTASVSDSSGNTATVTYQTGTLLGTTDLVINVTGDTLDEGTSVALSINGVSVGTVAINSSGAGTLIVPTSTLSTTVAASSTVTLGTMSGTFAASTTTTGNSGCGSSSAAGFAAAISDSSGDTATVTFQTGKLLGTSESVITVTGDTLDEGTSVALSINGVSVGIVAINSSGTGTLIVPTSTLSTTVAAGSTITLGTMSGTFAAATSATGGDSGDSGESGGCGDHGSSSGTNLTASVTDSSGDTATVTYQTGKLLGTAESVITVSGDTLDEGTSVALSINGVSVGTIAIDGTGAGTLTVPTSSVSTTVASGSTVTLGTLNGTFTSSSSSVTVSSSDQTAFRTLEIGGRHHGRG
jgi:hypothetical protein